MSRRRAAFLLSLVVGLGGCGWFRGKVGSPFHGGLFHRKEKSERPERAERPRPVPIDINTASQRKVEALSGITPSMAKAIVAGRPYTSPRDLVDRGILTERELDRIEDEITVPDAH